MRAEHLRRKRKSTGRKEVMAQTSAGWKRYDCRASSAVPQVEVDRVYILEVAPVSGHALHRILHRLRAPGAYWGLLAVPRGVSGSD